jgi:hypothetical protein
MPVKVGNCPSEARRFRPFRSLVDSPDPSGLFSFAPDLVAASGEIAFSAALAPKNWANSDRTLNAVIWSSAISTAPNTSRARSLRCSGVAALHAKGMLRRNSAARPRFVSKSERSANIATSMPGETDLPTRRCGCSVIRISRNEEYFEATMQAVFPKIRHALRALRSVIAGFYDWIPRRAVIAILSIAALVFIGFLTAHFWLADTIDFVGVVVALAALGVWKVPQWQAETAVRRNRERDRFETENAARGTLAQAWSGLFVVIGLAFAWRQLEDTRRDQINQETLNREGLITGRFTAAVGQRGDNKLQVRLGGVYALERIARDSKEGTAAVMEVLTAFVRQRAPWPIPPGMATLNPVDAGGVLRPFEDVEAVLTVINRGRWAEQWASGEERFPLGCLDLSGTNLHGARFGGSGRISLCLQDANPLDAHLPRGPVGRGPAPRTGADANAARCRRCRRDDPIAAGSISAGHATCVTRAFE